MNKLEAKVIFFFQNPSSPLPPQKEGCEMCRPMQPLGSAVLSHEPIYEGARIALLWLTCPENRIHCRQILFIIMWILFVDDVTV
jgi:hypothetical protein